MLICYEQMPRATTEKNLTSDSLRNTINKSKSLKKYLHNAQESKKVETGKWKQSKQIENMVK